MDDRDVAREVRNLASAGELLAAVDLARTEAKRATTAADRHAIQIEEVVALARTSSLEEAQEKFLFAEVSDLDRPIQRRDGVVKVEHGITSDVAMAHGDSRHAEGHMGS